MNTTLTKKTSLYPWLIWGLGAGYFFAEYFARVSPSVMVPDLMQVFNVTAVSVGSLSAFFYYAYVGMQVPAGALMDRFGPHRLLTITAFLCALSCFIFAGAHHLPMAHIARFFMGFTAAFAFIGALKLATLWFSPTRFGLLAGLTQALGMLGAAVGGGPLAIAVNHLGWRLTMVAIGIIILLLAVLIGIFARDNPQVVKSKLVTNSELWSGFVTVMKNPQSWFNALFVGALYAPTAAFAELWGVSFLVRTQNLSSTVAASAISTIFIGWAIGGPITGWISDKIQRRRPVMLYSAVASLLFMSAVLYLPNLNTISLFALLFLYGVANTGVATSYAVASEINPRSVAGISIAFSNMASVIVGALFQPLIGWFLDLQWGHQKVNGIPFYTAQDYRHAMLLIPICLIVAVISGFLVKETYCRVFVEGEKGYNARA